MNPDGEYYNAPRECPVCSEHLHVTRLGCPQCGTALSGRFRACEFCGQSEEDRALLRVFLTSRGTMREVERHLGVSHPTARARFDEMVRRLGLAPGNGTPEPASPPPEGAAEVASEPVPSEPDSRLATLKALAAGTMDVQTARRRLTD